MIVIEKDGILSFEQIDKLGNTALYFAEHIYELNKTKLLKLVYFCEEFSVKKHASPFLGLPFNAWKFGPVQEELWISLDPELYFSRNTEERASKLFEYIKIEPSGNNQYHIKPLKSFDDGQFSDQDMEIMELVAKEYKYHDAKQLVYLTHKPGTLWHKTVSKEVHLLEKFNQNLQSRSDLVLDFSDLLENEDARERYKAHVEVQDFWWSLKC